jgi:hypothetical protein
VLIVVNRRIGEIVGWHIDGLDRRHGGAAEDAIRSCRPGHLGCQCRLVADPRRHAPQKARHLGPRLNEAEHVVHHQEDVALVCWSRTVFRNRQRGQRHPPARAGGSFIWP